MFRLAGTRDGGSPDSAKRAAVNEPAVSNVLLLLFGLLLLATSVASGVYAKWLLLELLFAGFFVDSLAREQTKDRAEETVVDDLMDILVANCNVLLTWLLVTPTSLLFGDVFFVVYVGVQTDSLGILDTFEEDSEKKNSCQWYLHSGDG